MCHWNTISSEILYLKGHPLMISQPGGGAQWAKRLNLVSKCNLIFCSLKIWEKAQSKKLTRKMQK